MPEHTVDPAGQPRRKTYKGRVYLGLDRSGRQRFHHLGRFSTEQERDAAVEQAKREKPWEKAKPASCEEWAVRYLKRYERLVEAGERKWSSYDTTETAIKAFRRDFGDWAPERVSPLDAEDWASGVPGSAVAAAVAVFNYVIRMRGMPPSTNPFLGLGATRSRGRRDLPPPTLRELERIHAACGALGDYGPQLRDLLDFAALTIMRPSELFELRYGDVDLAHNRIAVDRRLYRGRIDTPKSGQKRIGLAPMARIILLRQPTRTRADGLVFVGKTGTRLNNSLLSLYWANVRAAAGLDRTFDFYRCSKHWGVHRLYLEGLSARAIAQQAGWSEKHVEKLLDVYAHRDLATLAEFDALYAESVDTDPGVTHEPRKARP